MIFDLLCDMGDDATNRLHIVQDLLRVSQPTDKSVQVGVEVVSLVNCLLKFTLHERKRPFQNV